MSMCPNCGEEIQDGYVNFAKHHSEKCKKSTLRESDFTMENFEEAINYLAYSKKSKSKFNDEKFGIILKARSRNRNNTAPTESKHKKSTNK